MIRWQPICRLNGHDFRTQKAITPNVGNGDRTPVLLYVRLGGAPTVSGFPKRLPAKGSFAHGGDVVAQKDFTQVDTRG